MRTEYKYTALAMALDLAFGEDSAARDRYLAIYGVEWVPLAERYGDDGFGVLGMEVEKAFARMTDPGQNVNTVR